MKILELRTRELFIYLLKMIKDAKNNIVDLKTGSNKVVFVMSGNEMVWGDIFIPRLDVIPKYLFLSKDNLQGDVQVLSNVKWDVS